MSLFFRRCFRKVAPAAAAPAPAAAAMSKPVRASRRPGRRFRPVNGHPAYVLVVDESGSTSAPFQLAGGRITSRMAAIRRAGQDYLRQVAAANPRQLAGVVGFSDTARICHPLAPVGPTLHAQIEAVRSLHPQATTNLSAGIALALGQLRRSGVRRGNLVVITDGAANGNPQRLPGLTAQARKAGVRIFTIGVGNNADGDYNRPLLQRLAQATRGRFASAHSFSALCRALKPAV